MSGNRLLFPWDEIILLHKVIVHHHGSSLGTDEKMLVQVLEIFNKQIWPYVNANFDGVMLNYLENNFSLFSFLAHRQHKEIEWTTLSHWLHSVLFWTIFLVNIFDVPATGNCIMSTATVSQQEKFRWTSPGCLLMFNLTLLFRLGHAASYRSGFSGVPSHGCDICSHHTVMQIQKETRWDVLSALLSVNLYL